MPRALPKSVPSQNVRPYARNPTSSETAVTGLLTPTQPKGNNARTSVAQSVVSVAARLVAVWPQVYSSQNTTFDSIAKTNPTDLYGAALSSALAFKHVKHLDTASTYVAELLKRSRTTYPALQLALLLMIRYGQTSSRETANIGKCGRRALLAALMLASKALNDRSVRTIAWAKVSGLSCDELNANEMEMLKSLDWSLDVSPDCYSKWCQVVLNASEIPAAPQTTCRVTLLATPPPEAVAPSLLSPICSP